MKELDTSGFNCPIPIIKAKKELNGMEIGETLKLISTDPGAVSDIESLCKSLNQELVSSEEVDNKFIFEIIRRS
jgi:tRNA 2-thiouridine synthesizing protein A|tara:strand:- start:307 stop:528 length:222 start_codon:yes stop_codon:yes gene_type:complete